MKLNLGYVELDQFEVEIVDNNLEVVQIGGGPFTVTLRSPKADKMRALYRRQADEFSRFLSKLPANKRDGARKPDDMAERHGMEVLATAHVRWKNAPVFNDAGEKVADDAVDFDAPEFLAFLKENEAYAVQILRALGEEKNYQTTSGPSKTSSSNGSKSKSS